DVSLGRWFCERAKRSPKRRALTFEGTTWTYAEMQDRIDRLAAAFRAGGVCHGDRIGFLGLNQPAFFETLFAASRLGAIFAPLYHIGGLNVTTLITWQKGGEVVLHRSFDAGACLDDIPRYGVTTMFGVPAMFLFMSQHPGFDNADLTSIRTLICGGAPVSEP